MANDSKISGLPVDSSPTYNDLVPVVSGNTTSQITTSNLVTAGSAVNPSNNTIPWMCHPQGRLSLVSGQPVINNGVTSASTIYYVPYIGPSLPIYNGIVWQNYCLISQLTLILNATQHTSGNLYDIFAFINSGSLTLACGPAWTNSTTRSAAISQVGGLWTNTASITLTANGNTYSGISANTATYLGTFLCTPSNATTVQDMKPSSTTSTPGAKMCLYNAYNQVMTYARANYTGGTWHQSSGSAYETWGSASYCAVRYVDGLGFASINYSIAISGYGSAASQAGAVAVALDNTSQLDQVGSMEATQNALETINYNMTGLFLPSIGSHLVIPMEYSNQTTNWTWGSNGNAGTGAWCMINYLS